ncbi:MAG: M67 family metallopeptidase [Ferrimicrobium sp.]
MKPQILCYRYGMAQCRPHARDTLLAHCYREYPYEACGLLLGDNDNIAEAYPTRNDARSARVFTVDSSDLLHAEQHAEATGQTIIGVFHSHTHSEAFPSPTDIRLAPDPTWLYLVVSLLRPLAELRAFAIAHESVHELALEITLSKQ